MCSIRIFPRITGFAAGNSLNNRKEASLRNQGFPKLASFWAIVRLFIKSPFIIAL
jgi:hypothetical protein